MEFFFRVLGPPGAPYEQMKFFACEVMGIKLK